MRLRHKFLGLVTILSLLVGFNASAAVSDWEKSASMTPNSQTDFSSSNFQQSLRNLKAMNANTVSLIATYYTSNCNSSDIQLGWNTPTLSSLKDGINYAHSLGMKVDVKAHLEAFDTWSGQCTWRANISPSDRNTFFANYLNMLKALAAQGPDELTIGAELINLTSANINPDNTTRWNNLIASLRSAYPGIKLNYSANWGAGNFSTETNQIQFWSSLDSIGISGYYELPSGTDSPSDIQNQWNHWNTDFVAPLVNQYGKPVQFTEIGYRSVDGARYQPWNYNGGGYDATEQSNLYQALFDYWNNYSYFTGINIWNWSTDPNAGGSGNTDYTPQNKPAQALIAQYFDSGNGGMVTPPPSTGNFSVATSATPASPIINQKVSISAAVKSAAATTNDLVDIEVYDSSNNKVHQEFFDNQSFTAGQTRTYTATWTPSTSGNYKIAVGVFSSGWGTNYLWNDSAGSLNVGTGSATPPPSNGGPAPTTCNDQSVGVFKGCYFDNIDLTNFKLARNDSSINFDWGNGSPDPSIGSDTFSAQWQGTFSFNAATYNFTATADDGIRVSVDGNMVLDKWIDEPATTYNFSLPMSAGNHLIEVKYYENGGGAVAKVSWTQGSGNTTPPPTNNPPPATGQVNIWWPSSGATVQGVQPFKAMVSSLDISQYQMYWQVDGGSLNLMNNSSVDYPHKESLVDVSGWTWRNNGPYTLNFVAKNSSGQAIASQSIQIYINH